MLVWVAALLAALAVAFVQYGGRRPAAVLRTPIPFLLRTAALTLLLALVFDAPAGRSTPTRPIVALDASQSWLRDGDSALWSRARAAALHDAAGDSVLLFGDSARTVPARAVPARPPDAATGVREATERALATGRPMELLTDGEIDDPDAIETLPAGSRVVVMARRARADGAVSALEAPRAVVRGDTVEIRVTIAAGATGAPAGSVTLVAGGTTLGTAPVDAVPAFAERPVTLRVPVTAPEGATVLRAIYVARGDAEPRNDTLGVGVDVSQAAGAVFVSTSPDFDARYALAVLRGAAALPTRGFYRVAPGQWRVDGSLAPVSEGEVRAAFRDAPIAVLHGDTTIFGAPRQATRGALALIMPADDTTGEWYATGAPPSPLSPALADIPWDSLPPIDVRPDLPAGDWQGLETRRARRFERRVAVIGEEREGGARRVVIVGASGLWRWRFRGGVSADAYTALWGSIFDWLAERRSDRRAALPDGAPARAGEPIRWRRGSGADSVVVVILRRQGAPARADSVTLRFARGATIAESAPLAPGVYTASVPGGTSIVVVNAAREWLPRRPTVRSARVGGGAVAGEAPGVRTLPWVYLLVVLLFAAEWLIRRRRGLR